mgnify:CR=1 FL=1
MATARVLLVEDERIIALDIKNSLERLGYEVPGIADDYESAVKLALDLMPDLVLMDIILNGDSDGIEAAREIKKRLGCPVIYLTANADQPTIERARETEPHGYLNKPINTRDLFTNIDSALYRHRVETLLRESEVNFRTLSESAPVAIMIYQCDRWVYANLAAEQISGYGREELLGMNFWNLVHPEHRELVTERGKARQRGEEAPSEYRFQIQRKNGEMRWVDFKAVNVTYAKEPAVMIYGIDITGTMAAEEALRKSEEKYRSLVESAAESVAIFQDNTIKFVNGALLKASGFSADDLLGKPFLEVIHPEDRQRVVDNHLRRLSGEDIPPRYDFRILDKKGNTLWVDMKISMVEWDGKPGVLAFLADVTRTKEAEIRLTRLNEEMEAVNEELRATIEELEASNEEFEAVNDELNMTNELLRRSEEKYRLLAESAGDMIFTHDLDGAITFINGAGLAFTGFKPEEVLGKHYAEFITPERAAPLLEKQRKRKEGYTGGSRYESEFINSAGKPVAVEVNSNPIMKDGKITGILSIAREIQKEKQGAQVPFPSRPPSQPPNSPFRK